MGLELTTDRYLPITSQTRYPLRHAASTMYMLFMILSDFMYMLFMILSDFMYMLVYTNLF